LGLALDEPKETDAKYEQDGLTFLVDNNLLDTCESIKIDFVDAGMRSGFSISSTKPIGGGGCSSSAGCSSSGCG
jgi:Fe-S cluster assembly iron-binding protein IscA